MTSPAPLTAAWTAHDVLQVLFGHFAGNGWWPLVEVSVSPPRQYEPSRPREETKDRRIDMLLVRSARKRGIHPIERLAIEVKVSRSDFLADVRNPHKQADARALSHRFAYAAPVGLIRPEELPPGTGLLEVRHERVHEHQWRKVDWTVRAPYPPGHDPVWPDWMTSTVAARMAWAEGRVKGLLGRQAGDQSDPDALRGEVERLNAELERERKSHLRTRGKLDAAKAMAALAEPAPCSTCGTGLRAKAGRSSLLEWTHVDRAAGKVCDAQREAIEVEKVRHRYEVHGFGGRSLSAREHPEAPWKGLVRYVPGPQPVPDPDDPPDLLNPASCWDCEQAAKEKT